jgi:hypothetical protein
MLVIWAFLDSRVAPESPTVTDKSFGYSNIEATNRLV